VFDLCVYVDLPKILYIRAINEGNSLIHFKILNVSGKRFITFVGRFPLIQVGVSFIQVKQCFKSNQQSVRLMTN
jgi:hypothetical protein